jgi:hypothetical protein
MQDQVAAAGFQCAATILDTAFFEGWAFTKN